jgi:hypothetical protein
MTVKVTSRKLRFEKCEPKELLAANVFNFSTSDGTLKIHTSGPVAVVQLIQAFGTTVATARDQHNNLLDREVLSSQLVKSIHAELNATTNRFVNHTDIPSKVVAGGVLNFIVGGSVSG